VSDASPDPGLQPERTLLAWRRTALSLALAGVVAVRLTLDRYGPAVVTLGGLGLALAGAAYLAAGGRHRRARGSSGGLPAAGAAAALLAATTLAIGVLAMLYVTQP